MSYTTSTRRTTTSSRVQSSRTTLGYWVPLVLTVSAASVAIGAWIWSERSEGDDYGGDGPSPSSDAAYARRLEQERRSYNYEEEGEGMSYGEVQSGEAISTQETLTQEERKRQEDESWVARVQGVVSRSPSPRQVFDGASRRFQMGLGYLNKGLRSISEEREGFEDHEAWSEEAAQAAGAGLTATAALGATADRLQVASGRGKGKTVAVVVSAEEADGDVSDGSWSVEHVSILSHLIGTIDPTAVNLLVLVYAPQLSSHPLARASRRPSGASSYEAVEAPVDDGEDRIVGGNNGGPLYQALQTQAQSLLSHPTQFLPFTTPTGHVHLLRHLAPNLVYMQESLAGNSAEGEIVKAVDGWVGEVVVVVGAEGSGLADTETEDEGPQSKGRARSEHKWWMDGRRVGLGKGVEIVDSTRVGEDWVKRVEGR